MIDDLCTCTTLLGIRPTYVKTSLDSLTRNREPLILRGRGHSFDNGGWVTNTAKVILGQFARRVPW